MTSLQQVKACTTCGKENISIYRTCISCRKYQRDFSNSRKNNKKCPRCNKDVTSGITCSDCNKIKKEYTDKHTERSSFYKKSKRDLFVSCDLCATCGEPKDNMWKDCEKCLKAHRDRYHRYKALGVCKRCGKEKLEDNALCEICWYRAISRDNLGSRTRWKELKDLIVSQNFKCAYSGRDLYIGVNASIDHKIPKSRGGSLNDITNLVWCDLQVNLMKKNMTSEEFIALCGMIVTNTSQKIENQNSPTS